MDDDRIEKTIAALRGEVAVGFAAVNGRLDGVNERLGGVDERLGGVDERLGGVDERLGGMDARLTGVDERLTGVDQQFAALHRENEETRSQLATLIDSVRDDVRIFAEAHVALEQRVSRLEHRQG